MPRGPRPTRKIRSYIEERAREGYEATPIQRDLVGMEEDGLLDGPVPHINTVRTIVRQARPPDPSGPWSFAEATDAEAGEERLVPHEARLVLDVAAAVEEATDGRVTITRELAKWIVRVGGVAPGMPPWDVYTHASTYRAHTERGEDTRWLDRWLAFRAWEEEGLRRARRAAERGGYPFKAISVTMEAGVGTAGASGPAAVLTGTPFAAVSTARVAPASLAVSETSVAATADRRREAREGEAP